ncbi:MAG: hypothetical protein ACYDFT_04150 [Thermoplasmata archaeon]
MAGAGAGRGRGLTDAEARVISVALANPAAGEQAHLALSKLPRSTYHAARRRVYAEGWLMDRYVPAPALFGYPEVTVAVARPFADRAPTLEQRWAAEAGGVLLYAGPNFALGLFFHRSRAERDSAVQRISDRTLTNSVTLLNPAARPDGFPVFFDFEGAWAHLIDQRGTQGYPTAIPAPPAGAEPEPETEWTPRARWAARELLNRPFLTGGWARPGHLVGPFGLPLAQRRLLTAGWLRHRVLLAPRSLPSYHGHFLDRMVLLHGTLAEGIGADALFSTLTEGCGVFPFLFAREGPRLLLGLLGAPRSSSEPRSGGTPRSSVTEALRRALREIESFEAPIGQIRALTDYRYDRMAPPPALERLPAARTPRSAPRSEPQRIRKT